MHVGIEIILNNMRRKKEMNDETKLSIFLIFKDNFSTHHKTYIR